MPVLIVWLLAATLPRRGLFGGLGRGAFSSVQEKEVGSVFAPDDENPAKRYSLVIDAGSTGSRCGPELSCFF